MHQIDEDSYEARKAERLADPDLASPTPVSEERVKELMGEPLTVQEIMEERNIIEEIRLINEAHGTIPNELLERKRAIDIKRTPVFSDIPEVHNA